MADEFQTGACNAAWWNVEAALDTKVSSSSIPVTSVNLQDLHQPPPPAVPAAGYLLDSSAAAFGLPSPSLDWTHNFQGGHDHDARGGGTNFHAMLQDDHMNSVRPYGGLMQTNQIHQATIEESNTTGLLRDVSHAFLVDQQHLAAGGTGNSEAAEGAATTTFFQGLLEPVDLPSAYVQDVDCRRTSAGNENTITSSQPPSQYHWSNFQQQLRFSNTSPPPHLFNTQIGDNARGGFFGSSVNPNPHYYAAQPIAGKPIPNNLAPTKVKSGGATRENVGIRTSKKSSSEPSFKKPRMEVPSPLPTFKVRKEKLGDRITALQQLVSPFGKTDTASVLYEAIEYIKFLHDQVNVLSTPYLKNGHPMQHQQKFDKANEGEGMKKDLRSRGLCLVPISSTFAVANEPTDFWTPTFGGTFR